jgi:integrase
LDAELQQQADEEAARNRKSLKDLLDTYEEEVLIHHKRGAATRRALDGKMGFLKGFIDRDPTTLTRSEIVLVLKQRAKVAPLSANRQLAYASAFFNWCVDEELLTANPIEKVKKPSKENVRDRYHSLVELREIWAATAKLGYPFKQLYRLLIVLPMRREEIAAMPIGEVDLSSDEAPGEAVWTLPSGRTKRANALRVPLSALARSIIKEAITHPDRPKESEFVFTTTAETSVSGFSKAKKRLDAEIQAARTKVAANLGTKAVPMPHWVLHDLRTTFNTLACDVLGIDAHVADRILNHVATATTSKVMRIYNRSELFEPRKEALGAWAELLEREVVKSGTVATPAVALAA